MSSTFDDCGRAAKARGVAARAVYDALAVAIAMITDIPSHAENPNSSRIIRKESVLFDYLTDQC
jgi:hypothetical protein